MAGNAADDVQIHAPGELLIAHQLIGGWNHPHVGFFTFVRERHVSHDGGVVLLNCGGTAIEALFHRCINGHRGLTDRRIHGDVGGGRLQCLGDVLVFRREVGERESKDLACVRLDGDFVSVQADECGLHLTSLLVRPHAAGGGFFCIARRKSESEAAEADG